MAQDIPNIDGEIEQMPSDMREDIADLGRHNLFYFAKGVLGYRDMTEDCHGPFCAFLETNQSQFKMALMPRDHYKTSVGTIAGNMQKAVKDTNERILIGNETSTNAERMLRAIRQHCESNRVFRGLYSDVIPSDTRKVRWNDAELDWKRTWIGPEPTFDSIGMTGASTSRHYTHITYDDPISEEAIKSEKVMKDTIARMSTMTALLVRPKVDTVWLIGTRWGLHDVYSWFRNNFSDRLGILARSVVEDGEIIFPGLLDPEILAIKRKIMGEYKYSCLMMNNPRNSDVQDMNIEHARFFRWSDDGERVHLLNDDGEVTRSWRLDELDITVAVDPAPAETISSDRNAITTVGITPESDVIILDVFAKRCTPIALIDYMFWLHERFRFRKLGIEGVAYQKSLKYFVAQRMIDLGKWFRVEELGAKGKKEFRIRGVQPILALRKMYFHPSQHILMQEMAEFPLGEFDDTIDSLSMHLQMWKGRLSPEHLANVMKTSKRLGNRIDGYSIRNDPGPPADILRAMRQEAEDEEIEPEVDWEEVAIR